MQTSTWNLLYPRMCVYPYTPLLSLWILLRRFCHCRQKLRPHQEYNLCTFIWMQDLWPQWDWLLNYHAQHHTTSFLVCKIRCNSFLGFAMQNKVSNYVRSKTEWGNCRKNIGIWFLECKLLDLSHNLKRNETGLYTEESKWGFKWSWLGVSVSHIFPNHGCHHILVAPLPRTESKISSICLSFPVLIYSMLPPSLNERECGTEEQTIVA